MEEERRKARRIHITREQWAWALYDWGNSAFATVVMAGFYPLFFKQYWAAGMAVTESTFWLGAGNAVAAVLVVAGAPVLGAMADQGGGRKRYLGRFLVLGCLATAGLFLVPEGAWGWALLLFALASIGFAGGNVFYDALLPQVADERRVDFVSALGYGLGYLGGGLLFAGCVGTTLHPEWLGVGDAGIVVRLSFLLVAGWWFLFALPLFLRVHEPLPPPRPVLQVARAGFRQLAETFRHIRSLRPVMLFLGAYWCYIDGVDTVIRMAVDYGLSLGLDSGDLITALLVTQFVGFPAAVAFGLLARYTGPRGGIYIALGVYILIVLWAGQMSTASEFYVLAVAVGLVQGGIQSLSRSFYSRLIPTDKAAEFFGFYNMLGKFAAVLGPLLVGLTGHLTGDPRAGILSILVLLVAGALLLLPVRVSHGGE